MPTSPIPLRLASSVFQFGVATLPTTYEPLYHRDGKTATVDVLRHKPSGVCSIRTNGKSDGAMTTRARSRRVPGPTSTR